MTITSTNMALIGRDVQSSVWQTHGAFPVVGDYQYVYLVYGWLVDVVWIYLEAGLKFSLWGVAVWTDMTFWSFIMGPILIFLLPILAFSFSIKSWGLVDKSNEWPWYSFKTWSDAATFPFWLTVQVVSNYRIDIYSDYLLPLTFTLQWLLLPINFCFGALNTTLLFPWLIMCWIYLVIWTKI